MPPTTNSSRRKSGNKGSGGIVLTSAEELGRLRKEVEEKAKQGKKGRKNGKKNDW